LCLLEYPSERAVKAAMADLMPPMTYASARRFSAHWHRGFQVLQSPVARYGLAVVSVAVAVGVSLLLRYYQFGEVALPIITFAIAVTTWYAGNGPSVVSIVLSTLCFDYFFAAPYYSFEITSGELPYFFIFVIWGLTISGFCAVRRRFEEHLHQAQEDLAKRVVELEAANKELEAFAYSASHDLRAPLRHVVGYAELLQKHTASVLDEKASRYLKTLLEAARRMGVLIDDLLGFSRIGRAETKKVAVDLEQLVPQVIAELSQDTGGRDIAWKVGALPFCYGDRAMLRIVLVNLISNAVKFTRARPQAEIEIGCGRKANDKVEIFVKDNGVGFDMEHANKLFGVFQRLHLPEEFEGTGIGLATVQRIVHRHGGTCWAESALDHGATFHFTVPRT
jgi:signal transduction histidine kinase